MSAAWALEITLIPPPPPSFPFPSIPSHPHQERVHSLLKNRVCKTNPCIDIQLKNLVDVKLVPTKGSDAEEKSDPDQEGQAGSSEEVLLDLFLNSPQVVKKIQAVDCPDLAASLKLFVIRVLLYNVRHTKEKKKKTDTDTEERVLKLVCSLVENDIIDLMQKR
jgi:hypothetical protein